MQPSSPRFKVLSVSPHPWERDAIEFLRDELPDADPIRVWALFEFVSHDGIVSEIDALVLSAKGFFLVEIKSTPGRLSGDNGTWTWTRPDGGRHSVDNPLLATNRKCKRLADLLRRHLGSGGQALPYLQPLVFLSATELDVQLEPSARQHVCIRDRKRDDGTRSETRISGIVAALTQSIPGEARPTRGPAIDKPLANAIARALERAGIRESRRARRFGPYELKQPLGEAPGYQDWLAEHASLDRVKRRVRIYAAPSDAPAELRQTYARAARREFTVLQDVSHPGILPALEYHDEDRGPGIVFPYDDKSQRLDHFVRDHGSSLTLDQRIAILRGIAEALQYAHEKQLVHRALSPLSVLVRRREGGRIDTQLVDWQAASRNPLSTSSAYRVSSTIHVHELVAPGAAPYLAPEHQLEANESGEQLDVFGLGAIAYLLFANEAPAADQQLARERLRQDDGFLLSAKVDASAPELIELIRDSTRPEVTSRYASIAEFNAQLDKVVDALTRPSGQRFHDPTAAEVGEILEGGWKIVRRLGKGSSAVVFLVERQAERRALKLALDPSKNAVLDAEAQVLKSLRHSAVVACREVLEFDGHRALLLDQAGDETLAERLRKHGPVPLELLQRFGDDLLSALQHLGEVGVFHRDIKPDNIGVGPVGRGDSLHLILFDFSLSSAPTQQLQAGTRAYLDPFLGGRERRHYDPAAERYAAAVTLCEMATGSLPRWGDGRSDPALVDDAELKIDEEALDAGLRHELSEFFRKALHRDAKQRFDTTEELRRQWNAILGHAATSTVAPAALEDLRPDTPLRLAGLSNRAVNALERAGIDTIRMLLGMPSGLVTYGRGIGSKTRAEILAKLNELRARFPELVVAPGSGDAARPSPARRSPGALRDTVETKDSAELATEVPLDSLVELLLRKPRRGSKTSERDHKALRLLLGGEPSADEALPWPTQTEVAKRLDTTTIAVHQALAQARARWADLPALSRVRDLLAAELARQGGLAALHEAVAFVADELGVELRDPLRSDCARQVLRAAVEAESRGEPPRFEVVRREARVWLLSTAHVAQAGVDPQAVLRYASELGARARELAQQDPLPGSPRVQEILQSVRPPAGLSPLPTERLIRLAAAAGEVAVSGRLELYPRGMPAERALRLAKATLAGAAELTVDAIRERVRSRYPEAEPLPADPTRLARLLEPVVPDLAFDAATGRWSYAISSASSFSGEATIEPTPSSRFAPVPGGLEHDAAHAVEERLQRAQREGRYLLLGVRKPSHETALRHLRERFELEQVSCESLLLARLRELAERKRIQWSKVLSADAAPAGHGDRQRLRELVTEACAGLADAIGSGSRTVLLTRPGILARYGRLSELLRRLRERTELRMDSPQALHGLWCLIPIDGTHEGPVLDGQALPVVEPRDWLEIPTSWLPLGILGSAS